MARSSNVNAEHQTESRVRDRQPYTVSSRNAVSKFIAPSVNKYRTICAPITLLLILGTFNVRGISKTIKQRELGNDCNFYNIDILALQETKCTQFSDEILPSKNRLIIFEQKDSYHGGLGFVISEKIRPFIEKWKTISDRVAYLDIKLPAKNGSFTNCRFVNVYCPHSKITSKSPLKLKQFYDQVNAAINVPARWELFVLGDFNSKLGKRTNDDVDNGFEKHMGKYGNGTRNDNGESCCFIFSLITTFLLLILVLNIKVVMLQHTLGGLRTGQPDVGQLKLNLSTVKLTI
jgi:hypothetical protein